MRASKTGPGKAVRRTSLHGTQSQVDFTAAIHPLTATSESWLTGANGNWASPSSWSGNATPNASTDVTISVAGNYNVNIAAGAAAAHSVLLNNATAKLNDNTSLSIGTNLTVTAGTFTIGANDTLLGGTLSTGTSGKVVVSSGATLSGVTYIGTLALAANGQLNLTSGFGGASAANAAILNDTAASSYVWAVGSQTLDNITLNLGNNSNWSSLDFYNTVSTAQTLTLGAHANVSTAGTYAQINFDYEGYGTETLINQGTITSAIANGQLDIQGASGDSFSNLGLLAANGGTIGLAFTLTTAQLGSFSTSGSGQIELTSGQTLTNMGATLTLGSAAQFNDAGTIQGGTIADAAGNGLLSADGTLSGVTYQGTLTIGADGETSLMGGFGGAAGSPATVNLTASNSTLWAIGTETLDNLNFVIGNNVNTSSFVFYNPTSAAQTLTLGSHMALSTGGAYANVNFDYNGNGTETIIDRATLTANVAGGALTLQDSGGDIFVNQGQLIANGGTIVLNLSLTTAGLGSFSTSNSGEILLNSSQTLSNTASTLTVGAAGQLTLGGTILGGTINDATGTGLISSYGTLNGVTYQGTLTLAPGGQISLVGGFGGAAASAATINASSAGAYVFLQGPEKLDNATLLLGNSTNWSYVAFQTTGSTGQTLTLGKNFDLATTGTYASVNYDYNGSGKATLLNQGTINAATAGGDLQIQGATGDVLINQGKLIASAGGKLDLSAGTASLSNLASGTLTGGSYEADASSLIQLANNQAITSDAATITLNGAGSVIESYFTNTGKQVTLDQKLVTVASGGVLTLLGGRGFAGASAFTDNGAITLAGGSFAESSLAIGTAGTVSGNGTFAEAVANGGTIMALSGPLVISGAVTGTGAAQIFAGDSLEFKSSVAAGQTVSFEGEPATLKLDAASSFAGTIAGITGGDTIDFAKTTLTTIFAAGSAAITASTASGSIVLALAAPLPPGHFELTPDGNGGTDATFYNFAAGSLSASNVPGGTLNLGVVHTNQVSSAFLTLTNTAPASYSEVLDAVLSNATGAAELITGETSLTGLAGGATNSTALELGLNTSATGTLSGTAGLVLSSDGTGIDGYGPTPFGTTTVTVTGIVDNYAVAAFADGAGPAIAGSGGHFTVNLGTATMGAAALTLTLGAENGATGLADLLGGTLSTSGGAGFTNSGFAPGTFTGLGAGADELSQGVTLSTSATGTFSETVLLTSNGSNADYTGPVTVETLTITGTIVPATGTTYMLAVGPNVISGAAGGDIFVAAAGSLNSHDQLTGGSGANMLQLSGGGYFDLGAPSVFANIPTIDASEGQAASGALAGTAQTIFMRDGVGETLNVAAGTAATGNKNPEGISIFGGSGADTLNLASGQDSVSLENGSDTITLGGASNSVTAGTGTAHILATIGTAAAAITGNAASSTTLEITTGGTATLNASDTYLTVKLDAASKLTLGKLAFITADGSNGGDTIIAGGASQTMIGGAKDSLTGAAAGGDTFLGASTALTGDSIGNWTTGDVIDLTDMNSSLVKPLTFASGKLTVTDGTHTSTLGIKGPTGVTLALTNFTLLGTDGHGGALIGYHG